MEEDIKDLDVYANDVININLFRPKDPKPGHHTPEVLVCKEPFHPDFTYSIFGEEEKIFGYRDLRIDLDFRAHDMRPRLRIQHDKEWKPLGETKAMDIRGMLKDFLPDYALRQDSSQSNSPSPESTKGSEWKPPGRRLHSYTRGAKQFEVWCASLADPEAKEILRGLQVLVPLFIEGGTCQNLDDQAWTMERWKLFLLYETTPLKSSTSPPYTFAGFATSYRLWVFPSDEILSALPSSSQPSPSSDPEKEAYATPFDPMLHPSRERISQFLIIPPYQHNGHGPTLYNTMYTLFHSDPHVFEITLEDPNEPFDDMRDFCDLATLRRDPAFASLALATDVPADALRPDEPVPTHLLLPEEQLEALRHGAKLAPRQFARVLEMHLLSQIPPRHRSTARITRKAKSADENDRRYYFWRLLVKERVYRRNRDQLSQLDEGERREKVEETVGSVQEEYTRLLEMVESRGGGEGAARGKGKGGEVNGKAGKRRRRVVDEEDDDDEEMDGDEDAEAGAVAAKRKKTRAA